MANVTMPTPVALAGGALCLLGGYLVGVVAGPDTEDTDTATVVSYDGDSDRLCLTGEAVADVAGERRRASCAGSGGASTAAPTRARATSSASPRCRATPATPAT